MCNLRLVQIVNRVFVILISKLKKKISSNEYFGGLEASHSVRGELNFNS